MEMRKLSREFGPKQSEREKLTANFSAAASWTLSNVSPFRISSRARAVKCVCARGGRAHDSEGGGEASGCWRLFARAQLDAAVRASARIVCARASARTCSLEGVRVQHQPTGVRSRLCSGRRGCAALWLDGGRTPPPLSGRRTDMPVVLGTGLRADARLQRRRTSPISISLTRAVVERQSRAKGRRAGKWVGVWCYPCCHSSGTSPPPPPPPPPQAPTVGSSSSPAAARASSASRCCPGRVLVACGPRTSSPRRQRASELCVGRGWDGWGL